MRSSRAKPLPPAMYLPPPRKHWRRPAERDSTGATGSRGLCAICTAASSIRCRPNVSICSVAEWRSASIQSAMPSISRRSAARRERLDQMRRAHELHHNGKAAKHQQDVEDARAEAAEIEQGRQRPGGGEGCAEHFGADENSSADDREDVQPENAAALSHLIAP